MALIFPDNPLVNDQAIVNGRAYVWDGYRWVSAFTANGYQGSEGYFGSTGYQGSEGYLGSVGFTGSTGYRGSEGYKGSEGYRGSVGFTGSVGFFGSVGYKGSEGYQGSVGYSGSTGMYDQTFTVALSNEADTLLTGTYITGFRAPFAFNIDTIPRSSLTNASSSGLVTVDINLNGTSILGPNKLSIDANEKTSRTAATSTTLSAAPVVVADDDEISFDIDAAGTGAKGLKVTIYFKR